MIVAAAAVTGSCGGEHPGKGTRTETNDEMPGMSWATTAPTTSWTSSASGAGSGPDTSAATTTTTTAPGPDICALIDAADVGDLLGSDVDEEAQEAGGCIFAQESPNAPSIAFVTLPEGDGSATAFNIARNGSFAALDAPRTEEPLVGFRAAVASGTFGGGGSQQATGLVQVDTTIVQVTVVQAADMSGTEVRALATKAMELVADTL